MEEATQKPGRRGPVPVTVRRSVAQVTTKAVDETADLEKAVAYVLADCFFAVGQTVGMRTTVDYEAVVWWHNHFRAKFRSALQCRGNRWEQDRETVTAVGWLLAERAVRHAAGSDSIGIDAARRAAADVERYCQHRSRRAARGSEASGADGSRLVGYWCLPIPC